MVGRDGAVRSCVSAGETAAFRTKEATVAKKKGCVSVPVPKDWKQTESPKKALTYSEKLRDPRWQRKRLEVMERDEFTCINCKCKDKTLNVHHWYYSKGAAPWEYENSALSCLCEECHEKIEELKQILMEHIGASDYGNGFEDQMRILIGYIKGWRVGANGETIEVCSVRELDGFAMAWHIDGESLFNWFQSAGCADGVLEGHNEDEDDEDEMSWLITRDGISNAIRDMRDEERSINQFLDLRETGYTDAGWWL